MSSEKLLIILVVLFLIAEIISTVVETNSNVKKRVQSNPFLNFVYQDAVGYVHIFEKTEMPDSAKLNGAIDKIITDAKAHGYKVSDADRSLIEGAVEYAVNKMHVANKPNSSDVPVASDTGSGTAKTVENLEDSTVNETVPDAPQLKESVDNGKNL